MRRVLVVNAGSSSLKWVVLDPATEESREQGTSTWPVNEGGRHERELGDAMRDLRAVDAVGHRVVHGGLHFRDAIAVDDAVRTRLAALSELAPLHNPA